MTSISGELRKEDIGSVIELVVSDDETPINISTALSKEIVLKSPSGTVTTKTAQFTTDGSNGKIRYTTVDGDLDEAGVWQVQGKIAMASGTWRTDIIYVRVYDNL